MKHIFTLIFALLTAGLLAQTNNVEEPVNTRKFENVSKDGVYTFVDGSPQYPGGDAALVKFIQKNLTYPETERINYVQGTAIVRIVVDEKGNAINGEVLRSSGSEALDREALRVTEKLKFKPGTHKGNNVKVYFTLPIVFKL